MKKIAFLMAMAFAATCTMFTGCDETPSKEVVAAASYALGSSSGLVVKFLNIDDDTKTVICDIINVVFEAVPAEGQTYTEAWTPIATKYIDEAIAAGKLPEALLKNPELTRSILTKASEIVFVGLDRLFEKYPTWKKYPDIVVAAVGGFVNGFKATIGCAECQDCTVPRAEIEAEAKIIAERCKVNYK